MHASKPTPMPRDVNKPFSPRQFCPHINNCPWRIIYRSRRLSPVFGRAKSGCRLPYLCFYWQAARHCLRSLLTASACPGITNASAQARTQAPEALTKFSPAALAAHPFWQPVSPLVQDTRQLLMPSAWEGDRDAACDGGTSPAKAPIIAAANTGRIKRNTCRVIIFNPLEFCVFQALAATADIPAFFDSAVAVKLKAHQLFPAATFHEDCSAGDAPFLNTFQDFAHCL